MPAAEDPSILTELARRYVRTTAAGEARVRERWRNADAWTVSQVAAAAGVAAARTGRWWPGYDGLMTGLDARHRYRDIGFLASDRGPKEVYVDDNAWIGLASVGAVIARGAFSGPGSPEVLRDLTRARLTLRLALVQEDPAGGVYWLVGARARHACTTGPAGILALRVLEAERLLGLPSPDGDQLLAFAARCSRFMGLLVDDAGMIRDHVREDASIDPAVFSYNQGTAIGLAVQRYRTTGTSADLAAAQELADACVRRCGDGGSSSPLWRDPPCFVSILCRNLLTLHAEDGDPRWLELARRWCGDAIAHGLDPRRGTLTRGGIGHYGTSRVLDLAGLAYVQLALATPPHRRHELV